MSTPLTNYHLGDIVWYHQGIIMTGPETIKLTQALIDYLNKRETIFSHDTDANQDRISEIRRLKNIINLNLNLLADRKSICPHELFSLEPEPQTLESLQCQ